MERLGDYIYREAGERTFGKALACIGLAKLGDELNVREFTERKMQGYRDATDVVDAVDGIVRKSAVGGLESDSAWAPVVTTAAQSLVGESVLGRVPGARRWRFIDSVGYGAVVGVGAAFRPPGRAIPVSATSFSSVSLRRHSVAGLAVASRAALEMAIKDSSGAETLAALLRDAVVRELDSVLCDANPDVTGERPAGLAFAAQPVSSTGATAAAIAADVRSMVDMMVSGEVSVRSACWVVSAEAFALLSTLKILDSNGTTLCGRPVVSNAPSGTFLLLAADYLTFAQSDQVAISTSTSGMIEMDTEPSGDVVTPVASSASRISLFQTDSVALRASLDVDWALTGPEDSNGSFSAVTLTSATFA